MGCKLNFTTNIVVKCYSVFKDDRDEYLVLGITPTDGKHYTLNEIKGAIKEATGFTPWIDCNKDVYKNHQLYQVYMCVDKTGLGFIECPVFPHGPSCGNAIAFPSFSATSVATI